MNTVVSRPEVGQPVCIAVDVSRSKWVYAIRWGGQEHRRLSTPGELHHLQVLVNEYRGGPLQVAYEACGFGYEIAWWLQEQRVDVIVVAPSTVERTPGTHVKTDRRDAGSLALKLERGMLKRTYIPDRRTHQDRQLSRTYALALTDRKRAQARVRSMLQEHGRIGPHPQAGWTVYAQWVARQPLPAPIERSVQEVLALRETALGASRRLKAALLTLAHTPAYAPVVRALSRQAGIGEFTAIRLVLELGDIGRFATAASFVHYLGLTPSEYSSGEVVQRGTLLKCGPRHVRAWLIQCAWASQRGRGPDSELQACYARLLPRTGAKRAIVAVARRLALRVRARWLAALPLPAAAA